MMNMGRWWVGDLHRRSFPGTHMLLMGDDGPLRVPVGVFPQRLLRSFPVLERDVVCSFPKRTM